MTSTSILPQNDLHSQPLAYLYFLTVLEYLLNQHSDLSGLLNVASKVLITWYDHCFIVKLYSVVAIFLHKRTLCCRTVHGFPTDI